MSTPTRQEIIKAYDERKEQWDRARAADPSHNQSDLPLNTSTTEALLIQLLREADVEISRGQHDAHSAA